MNSLNEEDFYSNPELYRNELWSDTEDDDFEQRGKPLILDPVTYAYIKQSNGISKIWLDENLMDNDMKSQNATAIFRIKFKESIPFWDFIIKSSK